MWFVKFINIASLITASIASNFPMNTVGGCDSPLFYRHHGYALLNHVIKTLPLFIPECIKTCQETLSCFSINYYKIVNNGFMCELNRSTKKQNPASYVRKPGYEYGETENKMYCEKDVCHQKEALANGWYKLNKSKFKFISQKKSWQGAKQHCQTIEGNLTSFGSELVHRFVVETINMTSTANINSSSGEGGGESNGHGGTTLVSLKMDGTDALGTLSLFGATVQNIDGKKAIFFDGNDDFVTIPRFDIVAHVTFSFWIKVSTLGNYFLFSDYDSAKKEYMFRFYISLRKVKFNLYNSGLKWIVNLGSVSEIPEGDWVHVAVTWNPKIKEGKLFINGIQEASKTSTVSDTNVHKTPHSTFAIGADLSASRTKLNLLGHMRKLSVVAKALTQAEISSLKEHFLQSPSSEVEHSVRSEGTWIGLNDITSEGTFQWSDNSPLHYIQQLADNAEDKDCVAISKEKDSSRNWMIAKCAEEKPFICTKK